MRPSKTHKLENKKRDTILIVDNSLMIVKVLTGTISTRTDFRIISAKGLNEAKEILKKENTRLFAGITGLILPGAASGASIRLFKEYDLPTIVMTSLVDKKTRDLILSNNVLDYVIKDEQCIEQIATLINRLQSNINIKTLVVDDSRTARHFTSTILKDYNFKVLEAANGLIALNQLKKHPDIKLVITDCEMPEMNGLDLVSEIRKLFNSDQLSVIGVSSSTKEPLTAQFLKRGAQDFLSKPFLREELYCRVIQNIEAIEHIRKIREAAYRDYLTGLHNRKYFFEFVMPRYKSCLADKKHMFIVMIDIDFFKKTNDTYGHEAGDIVLREVASLLNEAFPEPIITARFGGEEFCVFIDCLGKRAAKSACEKFRKKVENNPSILSDQTQVKTTVSMGMTLQPLGSLDEMIECADKLLYNAKKSGRNRLSTDNSS